MAAVVLICQEVEVAQAGMAAMDAAAAEFPVAQGRVGLAALAALAARLMV